MHHKQGQVTSTIKTTAIPLYKVKRSSLNHSRHFIPGITAIVSTFIEGSLAAPPLRREEESGAVSIQDFCMLQEIL